MIAVNKGATSPFLLVGDHAGRQIPARLKDLGIGAADLERHIAWDIGVQAVGLALADRLNACFIAQRYSRLVIDCNRDPSRVDSIPETSDGVLAPGNVDLGEEERRQRVREIFDPYHQAIADELDARERGGLATLLIALHSFTPVMGGKPRPWRLGVLHRGDSAFSLKVLADLRARHGETLIGDNQPYQMDLVDFTVPRHADARGLDYLELEIRQDLLTGEAQANAMAADIAASLTAAHGDS